MPLAKPKRALYHFVLDAPSRSCLEVGVDIVLGDQTSLLVHISLGVAGAQQWGAPLGGRSMVLDPPYSLPWLGVHSLSSP